MPSEFTMPELLERSGYRIHGRRADCVHCKGQSRLTASFTDELYYCHRCGRGGNLRTLARELGLETGPAPRPKTPLEQAIEEQVRDVRRRLTKRERVLDITIVVCDPDNPDVGFARALALAAEKQEIVQVIWRPR